MVLIFLEGPLEEDPLSLPLTALGPGGWGVLYIQMTEGSRHTF